MSIALNMIVGPYHEPFLQAALDSVEGLVDEYVIVDTAPENNPNADVITLLWRAEGNVKIIDMPRGEDKDFSFAAARELARINTESDWILRLDADEVLHENTIEELRNFTIDKEGFFKYDGIEVSFYHFMVYPWLYQYIEPKVILFRKDKVYWYRGVHEFLNIGPISKHHEIRFFHYGYCRGQKEVFKRWQLYVEIDGKPTWYHNTNPATILDDRISVCQKFTGEHPKVVQGILTDMFKDVVPFKIRELPRYSMSDNYVGLLLITYNDKKNLEKMISSFIENLDYPTVLHIIDMGSTDGTVELLQSCGHWLSDPSFYDSDYVKDVVIEYWSELKPLTNTMNHGFLSLMSRQECNYIGWIHPDMLFGKNWLSQLVATLQVHPELGKICSYNTREGTPDYIEIFDGQEQAYIIRRGTLLQTGLFDEQFIGIGGYEDWDLNNRIRREGLKVAITTTSLVYHKGMATRELRDTTEEQVYNRGLYYKKWGTFEEFISFE